MLSAHYRNPINFSHELMESAKNSLDRIVTSVMNLTHLEKTAADLPMTDEEQKVLDLTKDIYKKFEAAMDDDFNTADAISAVFELVKLANSNSSETDTKAYITALKESIVKLADILRLNVVKDLSLELPFWEFPSWGKMWKHLLMKDSRQEKTETLQGLMR